MVGDVMFEINTIDHSVQMCYNMGADTFYGKDGDDGYYFDYMVQTMVEDNRDVFPEIKGTTFLLLAAEFGRPHSILKLVEAGADPYVKDSLGRTPLYLAAVIAQSSETVEMICKVCKGVADLSLPNCGSAMTILMVCCGASMLKAFLASVSCDVNAADAKGFTALHVAAFKGCGTSVSLLLEAKATITVNAMGETALHKAASRGSRSCVSLLLKAKAAINQLDLRSLAPLHVAAIKDDLSIVKFLVKAGASLTAGDKTAEKFAISHHPISAMTTYLVAKTHCYDPDCVKTGLKRCTACECARYCSEACQYAHWKIHKADCKRWSSI
jgi:ankyrin repeat protein